MTIKINRKIAKVFVFLSKVFNYRFCVACKGYSDDAENYTGLDWDNDKDMDYSDKIYTNFEIWT